MALTGKVLASAFGFVGDGTEADTLRLQDAVDSGEAILMPPGVFELVLSQNMQMEGGTTDCCIRIRPGFPGFSAVVPGRTIFKLKDGQSTDANPRYFNMFGINEHVDGLVLEGCIQDLNGQNNKISPGRLDHVYNKFNCAGLMVSGSVATVGCDARLTNAVIDRWKIINGPGVTSIALAQSNHAGTVLGENIRITRSEFHNNGIDTDDHSTIYMWANDVRVDDCRFTHPTLSNGIAGPYAAAELHGSDNHFRANTVKNYAWGVYVAGNYTSVSKAQFVQSNSFEVAQTGVIVFNESATEPGMNGIFIDHNYVNTKGTAEVKAINCAPSQGSVLNVKISDNVLVNENTVAATGIKVGALAQGRAITNVDVSDNTIVGFNVGVSSGCAGVAGSVTNLTIKDNQITHVVPGTYYPTYTMGIYTCGIHNNLDVRDNFASGAGSHPYFGVYMDAGPTDGLTMEGNFSDIATVVPIYKSSTITGKRNGLQAQ